MTTYLTAKACKTAGPSYMHESGLVPFTAPLTTDHLRVRYAALQASGASPLREILTALDVADTKPQDVPELTRIHESLAQLEDGAKPCSEVRLRNAAPIGRGCCSGFGGYRRAAPDRGILRTIAAMIFGG